MRCVRSWFSQSGYLKSMVELISEQVSLCESPSKAHIFFTLMEYPRVMLRKLETLTNNKLKIVLY